MTSTAASKHPNHELALEFEFTLVPGSTKKAMSEAGSGSRDLWQVPISNIRLIPNFNARVKNERYHEKIQELANSMLREGFKQEHPLAGYVAKEGDENVIYLYAGHRRLEAAKIAVAAGAQIDRLPFVVCAPGTSHEDLTVDLVTGNSGETLSPFETGVVCKRLTGYGWEPTQVAERLGYTEQYVNDLLLLMGAPKVIRDMVQAEQVAATKAIEMLHKHGIKAVEMLQNSLSHAQAAGKTKVTSKFIAGAAYKKAVTKQAPVIVTALKDILGDPGYAGLSFETQIKLQALLNELKEAEAADGTLSEKNTD